MGRPTPLHGDDGAGEDHLGVGDHLGVVAGNGNIKASRYLEARHGEFSPWLQWDYARNQKPCKHDVSGSDVALSLPKNTLKR